jgi:hypothetical protein
VVQDWQSGVGFGQVWCQNLAGLVRSGAKVWQVSDLGPERVGFGSGLVPGLAGLAGGLARYLGRIWQIWPDCGRIPESAENGSILGAGKGGSKKCHFRQNSWALAIFEKTEKIAKIDCFEG